MATVRKTARTSPLGQLVRSPSLPVLLTVCAVAIGLAALLPLVQSSGATSINGRIQLLQQEKADRQAQLHELELEVARLGSLDRIEKEAKERLHMTPPKETHYLSVDQPAPEERRLPSRFLSEEAPPEAPGSSLWGRLFGWLSLP